MDAKGTTVKTKGVDGKPLELMIIRPNNKIAQEANMAYNMKVSSLIRQGGDNGERLLLRSEVEDHLIEAGIWSLKDAARIEQIGLKIRACELTLKQGGIKISQARKVAIKMGEFRQEAVELYQKRQQLDNATVEAVAEQYRFDVLVSKCTFVSTGGKPYFSGYDNYISRGDTEAAVAAAEAMAEMLHGPTQMSETTMFEVKWLKEAGLMNESGRYINKTGSFVDRDGKLVDENGRFVDSDGNFIDFKGRPVGADGDFLVPDPKPFVDDDTGEEVVIGNAIKSKTIKKKRKTRKKKAVKS